MKAVKVNNNKNFFEEHYPVVEMKVSGLIPIAYNWHKATSFRQIVKLYKNHKSIYDSWINQGLLPDYAIERVRNYQEAKGQM